MTEIISSANQDSIQSIKRQNYIKNFRQKFPEESKKLSDAQIITIMDNKIDEVEIRDYEGFNSNYFSLTPNNVPPRYPEHYSRKAYDDYNKKCEDYYKKQAKRKIILFNSSGRYTIWSGNTKSKYYAADGTELNEQYYKKSEEDCRMNNQITHEDVRLSDINEFCYLNKEIDGRLNKVYKQIESAEYHNGLFASLWSSIKNKLGFGDSSNKAKAQLKKERQIIEEKGYIEGFTALTGLKATPKNIEAFVKGKVKLESEKMLDAYREGQKMAVDVEGDLVSGIAAFSVYSFAIMAAPFTAGMSIAVGAAAAAATGALAKAFIKGMASSIGHYDYDSKDFKKDALTGAFSGVLAPISAGLGGAVGKTTAKTLGVEAVKHIGKKGVEQTAKAGLKETIKTGMLNPAGYKYTANSFIRREVALASELVTDGVIAGTIDGGFRAGVENDWQLDEMGKGALVGGVGGLILSPVIGRTLKSTGKKGHLLGLNPEERMKTILIDSYEKASPVLKEIIDIILNNEKLLKNSFLQENCKDLLNPYKSKIARITDALVPMPDADEYLLKTEADEVLASRLKILKQLKENPELIEYVNVLDNALTSCDRKTAQSNQFFGDINIKQVVSKIETLRKQMLEHPQMYISGEYTDAQARNAIYSFFDNKYLYKLADVFDNETLNSLMRKRLSNVREYLRTIGDFTSENMKLLRQLCNSSNMDGRTFTPAQKVDFIDLIQAYKDNKLDVSIINRAIKDGKVNLDDLYKILFNKMLKNIGLTDAEIASVPNEKIVSWDIRYIHLLANSIAESKDETYHDLIRATMLDDFMRYIHDGSNRYGIANLRTKEIFEKKGWNYEAYVKPAKENELRLVIKDKNAEQLTQEGASFVKIIEQMMQPPLDKIIKKQLAKYIKNDTFVIPKNILANKDKLYNFMTGVLKNLDNIKKRAEGNLNNPDLEATRIQNAKNTLTRFSDLQRIADHVQNISATDKNVARSYDLTVKMIDRVPQKDIFQGNYSTCCIGQGEFNDRAMAHYLMNTSYNMIELVDNNSGKTIGNALCYFVEDKKGTPYFIIDNIEINNSSKGSRNASQEIRDAITKYASNVVKQVTGKDDIHICISHNYNDVPIDGLRSKLTKIKFVGELETKYQYMDLFGGWESSFNGKYDLVFLK